MPECQTASTIHFIFIQTLYTFVLYENDMFYLIIWPKKLATSIPFSYFNMCSYGYRFLNINKWYDEQVVF